MSAFRLLAVADPGVAAPVELLARMRAALHERDIAVDVGSASEGAVLAAFAALVPDAVEMQRHLGIPSAVTAATFADVGSKHRLYGARTEVPWLLRVMRGEVLSMGRLQVEHRPDAGGGYALHIPQSGPLAPDAVDASLERAQEILGATCFTCTSWLLEPALVAALPASNIAAFARRFELDAATSTPRVAGAESAAKFVFRRPLADVLDPAAVVPRTRLERLVADRLRSGAGWAEPRGRFTRS